jgi:glycosyl transferase family 2
MRSLVRFQLAPRVNLPLPLSVVVVAYDIARELPRTLRSLAADYQRDISADDYEVIVVDNGSPVPVEPSVFDGLAGNFRLVRIDDASPSPAGACNVGLREASGDVVGVMVDGARVVSPGLLHYALAASRMHPKTAVVTLGWYLGFDYQRYAQGAGWTKDDEDALLASIDWPADGYRLFEISTMDESSTYGWFYGVFESNCLFLPASTWAELGGFDEVFAEPGGGLVNHDTLRRATELEDLHWAMLLGEGTFHQLHGGTATNVTPEEIESRIGRWREQYEALRGRPADGIVLSAPMFLGELPETLWPVYAHSINTLLHAKGVVGEPAPPAVRPPDPTSEASPMAAEWARLAGDAAREGREAEALELARRARRAGSTAPEVLSLLPVVATGKQIKDIPLARQVQFFLDAGAACAHAGDETAAAEHYREALKLNPGNMYAYEGLSYLRMPGPDYYDRLARVHELLNPASYLEIGVKFGTSLTGARPPTVAVAVDPDPRVREPIQIGCHLYRETSTEFFTRRDVRALFGGKGPSLVFIDGLHEFPTALEDFWRVEGISEPDTIVVLHDVIPFDEVTQRREQVYEFYTGDGWKLLHCLADVRPDLSWFTVRTPPSGLTFVTGLDASSTLLRDQYDKLVARYETLTFEDSRDTPGPVLENDWELIARQLEEWRSSGPAVSRTVDDGPALIEPRDVESLARQVRDLEQTVATTRKELAEANRKATVSGELVWLVDPESAAAELLRLRQTKLYRWTSPLRRVYARARSLFR